MKKLLFILSFFIAQNLFSQQVQQYNLIFLNPTMISPTVNEQIETAKIFINHKNQWIGYDEAPLTSSISSTFNLGEHVGLACYYLNDKYGVFNKNELSFAYSYELNLKSSDLIFGLGTKLMSNKIDLSNSDIHESGDNLVENSMNYSYIKPEADFGVSFVKRDFQTTLSIQNLLSSSTSKNPENIKLYSHYNLLLKYKYHLNENVTILPNLYLTSNFQNPAVIMFSTVASYQNKFNFGVVYNHKTSANLLLGFSQKYFSAYCTYEFLYNSLQKSNAGSLEISLNFNIFNQKTVRAIF